MQDTKYFETNNDGDQVLSSTDDEVVEVQNDGVRLSVNVVSGGKQKSSVHTYDEDEGYYRIASDEAALASELDALFRTLAREFGGGQITRNPGDSYELVVERDQIQSDDETATINNRTDAKYVLSPSTHHDALLVLDSVLARLAA